MHDHFINELYEYDKNLSKEIVIFKNNDDILNLAELILKSICVISPIQAYSSCYKFEGF